MSQNRQGINSHVEEYLDYYCDLHAPGFAILLKGQWGCGKTWFIKNYCKNFNEEKSEKEESNFLYISLYGITSFSEIELAFLQQSFPEFIADKLPLTTNIFNWILKAPSAVNLTDNLIKLINKDASKKILIFDDLERCKIDINNLLGYINSFVEHKDSKVIIIADEEKLEILLMDSNYKSIKEKLIGKTFNVSFDLEGSLNGFIDKLKNPDVKKFLFDNTNLIQDLYQQAEYKNLRTLNLIVLDFEKIFETFDDQLQKKVEKKPEVLQEVLKILIAFSIEIKSGILLPKDISILLYEHKIYLKKDRGEWGELSPLQKIFNKYKPLNLYDPLLGRAWWEDFFDRGVINVEELKKSIDLEDSLNDFIDKLKNPYVKNFLFDNTNLIQDLYQQAEYKNLRTLNLIVLDFEKIFETFDDQLQKKVEKKPEVLQEVLKILVAFSIEIKSGKLLPKDISTLLDGHKIYLENDRRRRKLSPLQKISNKYKPLDLYNPLLGRAWWKDFFDRGVINVEELKKSILNSKYFQDDNTPNWMKLFYFGELSDDDFSSLINEVELGYKNRTYNEIGIIKHIHGLLLHFSEIELYDKSKEEIFEDSKHYIDDLKERDRLSSDYSGLEDSYNSLTFLGQEFEEFKQLSLYIKQVQELMQQENMSKIAQDLLDTMQKNSYEFYRAICEDIAEISQDEYALIPKYYEVPILKYMKPDIFVEKLLSIKEKNQNCIFSALKQRYKSDNINKEIIEELAWLKSVKSLLQLEVDKRKGKLSGYKLDVLIKEYLNKAIGKLELKQLVNES